MVLLTNILNSCSTESRADSTQGYIQIKAVSHHTHKV